MKKLIKSTRSIRSTTNVTASKLSEVAITFEPEKLTEVEKITWDKFCCKLRQSREAGVLAQPFKIAEGLGLDLHHIEKESMLPTAIWVAFLTLNKDFLLEQKSEKYENIDEFLFQYPQFQDSDESEKQKLFETANWMNIFFEYMPAKKNKGLIIQVVPKFLEGWDVKYITGSGQTLRTRNRVTIYETEGNVKPYLRGKLQKKKKRSNTFTSVTSNEMDDNDIESDSSTSKRKKRCKFSTPRRGTTRPRKELIKIKAIVDNEALDSTEEESIDIDSNSENESDFEEKDSRTRGNRDHAIPPLLERFCSSENCDMDTLMPLLQKASSLESWNINSLHPMLQRFASNESAAFEECLAYFRDEYDYDEASKNKQLNSLFDSAPVIDPVNKKSNSVKMDTACTNLSNDLVSVNPISSVSPMDLQVPVVKKRSKTLIIKNKNLASLQEKISHDLVSPSFTNAIEIKSDTTVTDSNPENEFLIPPILLRDISWGPMNLAEPTKDITKMPAFPSPHSSYRPLDDLLFPFEVTECCN